MNGVSQAEPAHPSQSEDRRPSSRRDREREKDKGADDREKRARKELEAAYRDVCTARAQPSDGLFMGSIYQMHHGAHSGSDGLKTTTAGG